MSDSNESETCDQEIEPREIYEAKIEPREIYEAKIEPSQVEDLEIELKRGLNDKDLKRKG